MGDAHGPHCSWRCNCRAFPVTFKQQKLRPDGYASDTDALRAIVTLYSEAAIDASPVYYAAVGAPSAAAALDRMAELRDAAERLRTAWAQAVAYASHPTLRRAPIAWVEEMTHTSAIGPRRAWLDEVAADVRARLDGDMGRPLPGLAVRDTEPAPMLDVQQLPPDVKSDLESNDEWLAGGEEVARG